jgi:hypothetical protein
VRWFAGKSIHEANKKAARQQGGFLFLQGRIVPTEAKIPSKLSGKILWAEKGGCQAIFGK